MGTIADIKWGVTRGLIFGALYSALVAVLYASAGNEPFARNGTTFPTVVALYLTGSFAAGVVIGVLRPLLGSRSTAWVVGVLAAVPVSLGITVIVSGKLWNWSGEQWFTFIVGSLFFGIAGTNIFWGKMGD